MKQLATLLVLVATGCGYHVQGHTDTLPKTINTIYVPAWGNATVRYKLTDLLPQDITRELAARTRYKVVTKSDNADALLTGTVLKYRASPAIFDPTTSRASVVEFEVAMAVKLIEKATGKVLWENGYMTFKQRYEISTTPTTYFEESDPAITRLSREASRYIVDAILSNF